MNLLDRYQGALLGLAAGDAVGSTVEFQPRGSFPPVTDMVGGGKFGLKPGQWTDDTSMALCLAASLLETGRFDPLDQITRYCRWQDTGYMSSTGRCFDIGNTTRDALDLFRETNDPFAGSEHQRTAGNGSIMRLAPVALFFHPDVEAVETHAAMSSRTTHGAVEALDACRLLGRMISRALAGADKHTILLADAGTLRGEPKIEQIAKGAYLNKPVSEIQGSGYVAESLEAALWCFHTTGSFPSAILAAANLGHDADTTAAICGQLAGAHYGASAIPATWLDRLAMRPEITAMAEGLFRHVTQA